MAKNNVVNIRDHDWRPEIPGSVFWQKIKVIRGLIASSRFPPTSDDVVEWKQTVKKWSSNELIRAVKFTRSRGPGPVRTLVQARSAYYLAICEVCEERFKESVNKKVEND